MRTTSNRRNWLRSTVAVGLTAALAGQASVGLLAQVRTARRSSARHDDRAVATGPRGTAVKGEEGAAAVGRRGAAVKGEEGAAAVGRRGAAVKTEEGVARVHSGYPTSRRGGAVVVGDEGAAAVRRGPYGSRGVVVYEDDDDWKKVAGVAAGVAAGIAVGTLLAKPPAQSTPVAVSGTTYYYDNTNFYSKGMYDGQVVYQVVAPPPGVVVTTLPAGCSTTRVGGVAYSQCGTTYYQRVSTGYQVVVLR